jgi:hypothetical protein
MCGPQRPGLPLSQPLAHPIRRAEPLMGPGRLLRIVGRRVPPHHRRRAVPQQVLYVQLPGFVLYGPGGKGMAEAVGVHPRDGGLLAHGLEDGAHRGAAEGTTAASLDSFSGARSLSVNNCLHRMSLSLTPNSPEFRTARAPLSGLQFSKY